MSLCAAGWLHTGSRAPQPPYYWAVEVGRVVDSARLLPGHTLHPLPPVLDPCKGMCFVPTFQ